MNWYDPAHWVGAARDWLWHPSRPHRGLAGRGMAFLRILFLAAINGHANRMALKANALTFVTLLGLVPALAMSFAVAKGLGFGQGLKRMLLTDLGGYQQEVLKQAFTYVERTNVGTLGAVGLGILIFTLVLTLSNVEEEFNRIWGVRESRSWFRKFTDYLSVLILGPILLLVAAGAWAAFSSHELVQWLQHSQLAPPVKGWDLNLESYLVFTGIFGFMYVFVPNTPVPLSSGFAAGFLAAVMFNVVQWIYISFQVGVAKYNAIYGTFASLPLFLVWIHMCWLLILYGAEVAHAHYLVTRGQATPQQVVELGVAARMVAALRIMALATARFQRGLVALNSSELARRLDVPALEARRVCNDLVSQGFLSSCNQEEGSLQPARDPAHTPVALVLEHLCRADELEGSGLPETVLEFMGTLGRAGREALAGMTLADLAHAWAVAQEPTPGEDA